MRTYLLLVITLFTTLYVLAQPDTGITDNTVRISELVNQLPADNINDIDRIISELASFNEEAIITIAGKLSAPGTGDDANQRYAISGIVKFISHNRDPYLRLHISSGMCRAIELSNDDEVKDYLLQELQYIAGDEAVIAVAEYLQSPRLADPAARVLINIGSEPAKGALLSSLSVSSSATVDMSSVIQIVQALGETEYTPAAAKIRELAATVNPVLRSVSLRALAEMGDIESAEILSEAARKAGYDFESTRATSSWLILIENLINKGEDILAEDMIKEAIESNSVPSHTMAAIEGLSTSLRSYYYPGPENGVIRILTYNIKNCIGMDSETDFDRVAEVIKSINPHAVALQEVDKGTQRMDGIDVLQVLAEKTGMYYEYGPAIEYQGGQYGNGMLSIERPVSASYIPLPGRQERRSLLKVEFQDYILYATHLNNTSAGDRHGSVMIIDYEAKDASKPLFLAGDINDRPGTRTLDLLNNNWVQLSGNEYTFRSDRPDSCIDFIFGLKQEGIGYEVLKSEVVNEPVASDHLPVFVDVRINRTRER